MTNKIIKVKNIVMFILRPMIVAYGLMYLLTFIDPIRNGINIQTFIICLLAVYLNIGIVWYISKKGDIEMYNSMINDGLSDNDIICIIGEDKWKKLLKYNYKYHKIDN